LKAELDRRAEEHRQMVLAMKRERNNFILENIDAILQLVPEHGRTSCSDDAINNGVWGGYRCKRCILLDIRNDRCIPDAVDDITIDIEYNHNAL
jgi:hypothetical protein